MTPSLPTSIARCMKTTLVPWPLVAWNPAAWHPAPNTMHQVPLVLWQGFWSFPVHLPGQDWHQQSTGGLVYERFITCTFCTFVTCIDGLVTPHKTWEEVLRGSIMTHTSARFLCCPFLSAFFLHSAFCHPVRWLLIRFKPIFLTEHRILSDTRILSFLSLVLPLHETFLLACMVSLFVAYILP